MVKSGAFWRWVTLASLLLFPTQILGQTVTGSIQGTVKDAQGGVVPGVTITLTELDTGQTRVHVTNDVGFYQAVFLALGRYRVTAELQGFGTVVREPITVGLNTTSVVDVELNPAAVNTVITVTADAAPINSTNFEIKTSFKAEALEDRPNSAPGSLTSLAEPLAGFSENPTSGQNNPTLSSGSSVSFNGTGSRGATFQINGVNNDDASENQNRQGVSLLTIKEFQVIQNGYSAEFGRGYGAVVLVQTKSGSNTLRGDAYGYFQDSDFNARRFFATVKPINSRQQGGAALGFPIVRDRLFGFVSFDRTRSQGDLNYTRDLFLASELALPRLTRGNDTPENRAFINSVLSRFPAVTPNDSRNPRTYSTVIGFKWPDSDYSGRVDWQPRTGDSFHARYQYTRQIRETEDVIQGEQARQNNRQANVGVTWTHVFAQATVGEFRYGLGTRATRVDIAAGNDTPIIRFSASPVSGSIIGNAGTYPISRDQLDHQFVYNFSTVLGTTHSIKAGTDIRLSRLDDRADSFNRGFWTFTNACGGVTYANAYLAFLDGCVSTYQQAYGPNFLENRLGESNVYIEDNWRIRPSLTVNLGVRYEYVRAPSEIEDRIDYGMKADSDNVEPRLGFAWSPAFSRGPLKWLSPRAGEGSIRGGFGIYHGRIFQSVFSQSGASVRTNPPYALSRTVTNQLNVSDPTNGFVFQPGLPTTRYTVAIPDPDLGMPSTRQWNLTIERNLPWDSSLRISYTGTATDGLIKYDLDNLPKSPLDGPVIVADHPNNAPAAGFPDLRGKQITAIAADVLCAGTGVLPGITVNAQCPNVVPIADNEISSRVPRTNERRPDPRYGTNLLIRNSAELDYHGLQVEWTKRLAQGLQFLTSYTWSKAIDTNSEATAVGTGDSNQNGPNRNFARGLSRTHTPHRFTFNGSYRLPFFADRRDLAGLLLGGWQVSTTVRLAAGNPFTVTDTARDLNFDGFSEARPIILDPSILGRSIDNPATSQQQLPRSAFRSTSLTDVNPDIVGRNTFFLDGTNTVDLGIGKSVNFAGRQSLLVRVELFNAFNQVQFGFPSVSIAATNFGQITTLANSYQARVVQLLVRYRY